MNILVVDNGSVFSEKIPRLFDDATVSMMSFDDPDLHNIPVSTLVVLSGGRNKSVYNHPETYQNELDFIRKFGGPIIGICLGFQLIAYSYGEQLYRRNEKRQGLHVISSTEQGRVLLPEQKLTVYESHFWYIKDVSDPLIPLAESEDGIEIFAHPKRRIYATQFHPEVHEGNQGREIFKRILQRVDI